MIVCWCRIQTSFRWTLFRTFGSHLTSGFCCRQYFYCIIHYIHRTNVLFEIRPRKKSHFFGSTMHYSFLKRNFLVSLILRWNGGPSRMNLCLQNFIICWKKAIYFQSYGFLIVHYLLQKITNYNGHYIYCFISQTRNHQILSLVFFLFIHLY